MRYTLYKNDTGAINEGYSDIMGSLLEIQLDGRSDGSWLIGENFGEPVRNLANPHECAQPEFTFDTYYFPKTNVQGTINDNGGVHKNASLLTGLAVKLDEAGMSPEDQAYFWMNSAFVISPQTDYQMIAKILPWVMKELGYEQYLDVLNKGIAEAKFTLTEAPEVPPEGCGVASFDFSDFTELVESGRAGLSFFKPSEVDFTKQITTWPAIGTTTATETLPAGEYYVVAGFLNKEGTSMKRGLLTKDGWKFCPAIDSDFIHEYGTTITVKEGETLELPYDNYNQVAAEILKQVEPEYLAKQAPTAPTSVKVSKNGKVTWKASEKADYYKVVKVANDSSYYSEKVTGTSYTLGRIPTTDYQVYVIACNKFGTQAKSEAVTVKDSKPLSYVNEVKVDKNGKVTWKAASNAVDYRVVKVVNGKYYYSEKTNKTSYSLKVVPQRDYKVFVIAYDEAGRSAWGKMNTVEVGNLGVVMDTKVDKNGKVTWSAVRNAVSYRVVKVVNGKSSYGNRTTDTSYTLKGVPSSDYQVYVVAADKDGNLTFGTRVNVKAG